MSVASTLDLEVSHCPAIERSRPSSVVECSRLAAYQQFCRPRIALMSAVAVAVGFTLASTTGVNWFVLLVSVSGIVCFVAASSTLNQVLERESDGRMARTEFRPLVRNSVSVSEATGFGILCAITGFAVLVWFVNASTAIASMLTMLVYVLVYTPLKSRSILCTTIGAIPGAMPPVLGWLAAGGELGVEAWTLFAIFFVWQFPHFLAIAWIYREQYQRAGLKMLPSFSDGGLLAGIVALTYATVFVPVSCLPRYTGLAGNGYLASALVLSFGYLLLTYRFSRCRTDRTAKQLMAGSLICLPILLLSLVVDFLRLTS